MTKRMLLGLVTLLTAGIATGTYALGGGRHHGPGFMKHFMNAVVEDALDHAQASAEQKEQIKPIRERIMASFQKHHESRDQRRDEFFKIFTNQLWNEAQIGQLREQVEAEHRTIADTVESGLREVHAILTPEQRQRLVEYLRSHHPGRG